MGSFVPGELALVLVGGDAGDVVRGDGRKRELLLRRRGVQGILSAPKAAEVFPFPRPSP